MPSDYNAITKHNERQLGLDTASRKTQISMYSDPTHFIYEILQNADDYGATEILFNLSKGALLVEHNGSPFAEENVRAITYFGKSTSRDDLVKTGRFGVGFKSVFAFTATPIVISGDEHFQIYGLYRVRAYSYPDSFSHSITRIILPFNHESEQPDYVEDLMTKEQAYSKISERLMGLNMNTLLFTRNIREIRWEIDGRSGHYLREDERDNNTRQTEITDGNCLKKYLVFSRVPLWENVEYKAMEIAFSIEQKDEKDHVSPEDNFLYVLFPTTQETHLNFILNGAYRTNPSRETISEEDPFNLHLMKETCALMKDVFPKLREMGLLTTQLLSILPNSTDNLRGFYKPLREAILETFRIQELVPTDDNQYACTDNIFQGPAPIREVITKKELSFFVDRNDVCWAKGVQVNSRTDYFLRDLGIQQWGWKQLQETLNSKYTKYSFSERKIDTDWLVARSDSWLQKLYSLLAEGIEKKECNDVILKRCEIVRIFSDDVKQNHVTGPEARFPKQGYQGFPQVKPTLLQGSNKQATQKIYRSLSVLGVSEIDNEDWVNQILKNYYSDKPAKVSHKKNLEHMGIFITWWESTNDKNKFSDKSIFHVEGKDGYFSSKDCFLDSPLEKTGLNVIYLKQAVGIPKKNKLWRGYQPLLSKDFCGFVVDCGVEDSLTTTVQFCLRHPNKSELMQDYLKGGVKITKTGIDLDCTIIALSALLKIKDKEVNNLIWKKVSDLHPSWLAAEFRPNQQYTTRTDKSSLVIVLSRATWIPDISGQLHRPCDLTKEQLHPNFKYDNRNGWLDKIGFGENVRKRSEEYQIKNQQARNFGFASVDNASKAAELVKLLEEDGQSATDLIAQLKEKKVVAPGKNAEALKRKPPDFNYKNEFEKAFNRPGKTEVDEQVIDTGKVRNPALRRERSSAEHHERLQNEPSPKERRKTTSRTIFEVANEEVREYLIQWYQGECQICHQTFPEGNGNPFFIANYIVPRKFARSVDTQSNAMCLCADHFAKWQHGAIETDNIWEQVKNFKTESEGGENEPILMIKLCGEECEIQFNEKHLLDLQMLCRASGSQK